MFKADANFYGRILIVVMVVTLVGLYTAEPAITGFAVKETKEVNSFFDVDIIENDPRTCADGSLNGECSTIIKPKFCLYGTLVDYCELCGCDNGEVCSNHECV